jgi:hypothetical protein
MAATVVDIENVCATGREIAADNGLSNRITYLPADFVNDPLPGGFDLALLCDVGVFGEALYRRLYACLNPGGRLAIVFHFSPSKDSAPASRLTWTFLDSLEDPDFSIPTIEQTRDDLVRAGFQLLPGEYTLFDNRILIQAQR